MDLLVSWVQGQKVPGLKLEVLREKGRTPLIFMTVPGTNDTKETVLLYGHMDKQPVRQTTHTGTRQQIRARSAVGWPGAFGE